VFDPDDYAVYLGSVDYDRRQPHRVPHPDLRTLLETHLRFGPHSTTFSHRTSLSRPVCASSSKCSPFLAGRRQIGRFDRGSYHQELFEGHSRLAKAALTERERVNSSVSSRIVVGSVGSVSASGNARGAGTKTVRAEIRRGREGSAIALSGANREAKLAGPRVETFGTAQEFLRNEQPDLPPLESTDQQD
jgi:hypothetical protein